MKTLLSLLQKALLALITFLLLASPGFGHSAPEVYSPAIYLLGGYGGHFLQNNDINDFYGQSLYSLQYDSDWNIHLGLQLPRLLAVEGSVQFGPYRSYSANFQNSGITYKTQTQNWNLITYSITPALTWVNRNDFSFEGATIYLLGFRFGWASLSGGVNNSYPIFPSGGFDEQAQTFDYGIVLRVEEIVLKHISIGLEGGYDWTRFPSINASNGNGSSSNPSNPVTNANGATTAADFSGWRVGLVIGFWTNSPAHPADRPEQNKNRSGRL